MVIYYLTGTNPINDNSGPGICNKKYLAYMRKCNATVVICDTPGSVPDMPPDLFWLANIGNTFPLSFITDITREFAIKFVLQEDGYSLLCPSKWSRICFADKIAYDDPWAIDYISSDVVCDKVCQHTCMYIKSRVLTNKCTAFVAASPMHSRIWCNMFPILNSKCVVKIPPIDTRLFRPTYINQVYNRYSNTYMYGGSQIAEHRGYSNTVRYVDFQGGILSTYGDPDKSVDDRLIRNWRGYIEQKNMPLAYSSSRYYIYIPEWPDPMGIGVIEALLCGCTVIVNDRVGAISHPFVTDNCRHRSYYIAGAELYDRYTMLSLKNKVGFVNTMKDAQSKLWRDVMKIVRSN